MTEYDLIAIAKRFERLRKLIERASRRLGDIEDEITEVVDECGEDLERMQAIIRRHNG